MVSPARRKLLKNVRQKRVRKNVRAYAFYTIGGIVLFVLIVGGLAYGAHRPEVTITTVSVKGTEVADADEIKTRTEHAITGTYFFLFPKANIFLYPEDTIAKTILASDTRIKSADISHNGNEIIIIVEHTPTYLWCDTTGDKDANENTNADEKCFFANDEGYVFAEAPSFSGHVYITLRGPLYGEGVDPRGKRYLPIEQFTKISEFISLLSGQNITAQSVRAMGSGDYAVNVKDGTEVRFSIAQDAGRLAENLQSATAALADTKLPEYIDLRFGNKVFYK